MRLPEHDVALHTVAAALRRLTTGDAERIATLCYLADWKAALVLGRQLTDQQWTVTTSGPDTAAVETALMQIPAFRPGGSSWLMQSPEMQFLTQSTRTIIDHVAEQTKGLRWIELSRLAQSTWPAMRDVGVADLVQLAVEKTAFENRAA